MLFCLGVDYKAKEVTINGDSVKLQVFFLSEFSSHAIGIPGVTLYM